MSTRFLVVKASVGAGLCLSLLLPSGWAAEPVAVQGEGERPAQAPEQEKARTPSPPPLPQTFWDMKGKNVSAKQRADLLKTRRPKHSAALGKDVFPVLSKTYWNLKPRGQKAIQMSETPNFDAAKQNATPSIGKEKVVAAKSVETQPIPERSPWPAVLVTILASLAAAGALFWVFRRIFFRETKAIEVRAEPAPEIRTQPRKKKLPPEKVSSASAASQPIPSVPRHRGKRKKHKGRHHWPYRYASETPDAIESTRSHRESISSASQLAANPHGSSFARSRRWKKHAGQVHRKST